MKILVEDVENIEFLTDETVADMIDNCETIEDIKAILMILLLSEPGGSNSQLLTEAGNRFRRV